MVYFTDPTGSSREKPTGVIYRYSAQAKVTKVRDRLAYPNGIVIDSNRHKLYVDETATNRVLIFDLVPDGTLSNKQVLYQFSTDSVDGLSVDELGRVWVARLQNGTVDVLSPKRGLLASYPVGDRVTNMAWWDKSLYITVAGQHLIYRCKMGFDGAK